MKNIMIEKGGGKERERSSGENKARVERKGGEKRRKGTYLSTSHDTRQIIICFERRFVRFPNNREGRSKTSKSTNWKLGCSGDASHQLLPFYLSLN